MFRKTALLLSCLILLSLTACKGDLPPEVSEPVSSDLSSEEVSSSEPEEVVSSEETVSSTPVSSSPATSSAPAVTTSASAAREKIDFDLASYTPDPDSWQLKPVNGWHPLPEGFMPSLTQIDLRFTYEGYRFDSRAVSELNEMCAAAAADGVRLLVISPWRSNERQTTNFNAQVEKVLSANPGLTRAQAEDRAATVVARPWTSEHQLGLAVDFNSVEESFENTAQFRWLQQHAEDYGFILRYKKEKQTQTGVIYEPWHYRYVGVENAMAINRSGLCMEEFLEYYSNK